MVQEADTGLTPLQRKMKEFVHTLIVAILLVGAFNFGYGVYLGYSMSYSFLGAVSLVVAAIPEMLPALVTSILALSGVVMAGRKALIRKLPAAETLGATSVICSDKTGTLTENRMTVTRIYAGGQVYDVTGTGFDLKGEFRIDGVAQPPRQRSSLMQLLACGFYCNNAHLSGERGTGDPTELALRICGAKAELVVDGRPVVYPAKRIGQGLRPFTCWKFRTMVEDAEAETGPVCCTRPSCLPATPCALWDSRSRPYRPARMSFVMKISPTCVSSACRE